MDLFHSQEFSSHVEELIKKHHVPGIAIAIVQNETIASAGFGKASLDPPKPCTADTLFDIASSSKSLTGASVGLLVNDNDKYPEVQYEATMSSLLPDDFVMSEAEYTAGITVEDILSHRTGLPSHDSSYLGVQAAQPDDAQSITRNLRNLPVVAPIRTKYMYSNMMYTVATYLVEKKSGLPFADYLQSKFFQPLGMLSTNLQPERTKAAGLGDRLATGYFWSEKSQVYRGFQIIESPEGAGAGSIITSVNDHIKWVKAMMNQESPIDEDVYKGLVKSRTFQNPDAEELNPLTSPITYCVGLEIFYYRGQQVIGHDGCVPGFCSRHFFVPALKFGCTIFANSDGGDIVIPVLARELIDEALRVPVAERPDWEKIESERNKKHSNVFEDEAELRQKLCPGIKEPYPQEMPLSAYTGEYRNPGYHSFILQIKDEKLFSDASDRSFGFTLVFNHIAEQTKYIVHLRGIQEEDVCEPLRAEFKIENGKIVKLGLFVEPEMEEMIWFDRVSKDVFGES